MPRLCGGSQSNLAERRTIFPRQTLSIVPVATGTDSAPTGTPATDDTGATSPAPSGALTSAPSSPTGRQDPQDGTDPQDSTTAVDGTDPTTGPSDGVSDGTTKGTSSSTTTNSNDTTTKPSDGTSKPTTTSSTTTKPTTKPTTTAPTTTTDTSTSSTTEDSTTDTTSTSSTTDSTSTSTTDSSTEPPPTSTISDPPTSPTPQSEVTITSALLDNSTQTESFETTITSAIATTVIDGSLTSTIFTTIPTTLASDTTTDDAGTKRNIIAGTVGGAAFIVLITALFLFYRRHQSKKLSFFTRLQPKPRTRLLDGEDMDDYDLGPPTRYRDYPASVMSSHSHSRSVTTGTAHSTPVAGPSPMSREFRGAASPGPSIMGSPMNPQRATTPASLPAGAAVPHLLGMRAETGSIFREAVWPPPGEPSTLVDPLVKASSTVDLSQIVDDVMGPSTSAGGGTTTGSPTSSRTHAPPSAFRGGTMTANTSTSSLLPDDPFASFSNLSVSHAPSMTHSRETSDAPLLPASTSIPGFFDASAGAAPRMRESAGHVPGSPLPPPQFGPLFVTNMGPLSPSSTIAGSPPPPVSTFAAQEALGQAPSPTVQSPPPSAQPRNWLERSPKKAGRASIDGADVTEASSQGHGVGEAM